MGATEGVIASSSEEAILAAFLDLYSRDIESGKDYPLKHYQALFPGRKELIAREHSNLSADDTPTNHEVSQSLLASTRLERIGPYRILDTLGEGAMGTVYLGVQDDPKRRAAVKVIQLGLRTKEVIKRFEAERQAIARMNHDCIAKVYEAGATATGEPYFAMEYVEGRQLVDYCDEQRMTIRERLLLFRRVCSGVSHAHQKAIIHRDLKPSNILVTEQDGLRIPKIIDFGLAKSLDDPLTDQTVVTRASGRAMGTPLYMSPEQAVGTRDVDTRSDVYSLGAVLYILLCGCPIFPSETVRKRSRAKLLETIQHQSPRRPSERFTPADPRMSSIATVRSTTPRGLVRTLRGDVDRIVMMCLRKDPKHRYESTAALSDDVLAYLEARPVQATNPALSYLATKFAQRHHRALIAAMLILAMLGTAIAWARTQRLSTAQSEVALGHALLSDYITLTEELPGIEEELRARQSALDPWAPIVEKEPIWKLERLVRRKHEERERMWLEAINAFQGSLAIAGENFAAGHTALAGAFMTRFEMATSAGQESSARLFAAQVRKFDYNGELSATLNIPGQLTLTSNPPNAEVYLFRCVERDLRLWPISARTPESIAPHEITIRDVPLAPSPVYADSDTRSMSNHGELYEPLSEDSTSYVGRTPLDRIELIPGSYVAVLRLPDRPPVRFPLVIKRDTTTRPSAPIRIPSTKRYPAIWHQMSSPAKDWVWVPTGSSEFGGDPDADQGFDRHEAVIDGFFMSRFEVTWPQYIEFLNDPNTISQFLKNSANPESPLSLVPRSYDSQQPYIDPPTDPDDRFEFDSSPQQIALREHATHWPVFGVSWHDASAFAAWMTAKDPAQEYEYRLPTAKQWERAARGADGRHFPWGDGFDWTFCKGAKSRPHSNGSPEPVGAFGADESPVGVRDLAGNVSEWCLDRFSFVEAGVGGTLREYRGGSWGFVPVKSFRACTRHADNPNLVFNSIGIRIVCIPVR